MTGCALLDSAMVARQNGKRLPCEHLMADYVKLRELVRDMWHELDAATQYDAGGGRGVVDEFADRMRKLGVKA